MMLTEATAKLAMKNALETRELQGISYITLTMPAADKAVTDALAAVKGFAQQHKNATPEERESMGPMHARVWRALLAQLAHDGATDETRKQLFQKTIEEGTDVASVAKQILHCSVTKTFHANTKKIRFAMHSQSAAVVREVTIELMKRGAKEKVGAPPPSGLERDTQHLIDSLRAL